MRPLSRSTSRCWHCKVSHHIVDRLRIRIWQSSMENCWVLGPMRSSKQFLIHPQPIALISRQLCGVCMNTLSTHWNYFLPGGSPYIASFVPVFGWAPFWPTALFASPLCFVTLMPPVCVPNMNCYGLRATRRCIFHLRERMGSIDSTVATVRGFKYASMTFDKDIDDTPSYFFNSRNWTLEAFPLADSTTLHRLFPIWPLLLWRASWRYYQSNSSGCSLAPTSRPFSA